METLESTDDFLRRAWHVRFRAQSMTVILCQPDPADPLTPRDAEELEALLTGSLGHFCWRLSGRYVGAYREPDDHRIHTESLRRSVEEHRFESGRRLTISIGMGLSRLDLGPLDQLLRAEQALLSARQAGGNRVVIALKHDSSKSERNRLGRKRP